MAERPAGGGPRTAVGVSGDGRRLWLVVADGRQPGWSLGASDADLRALFGELGAVEAMSLDGGGSATMVARGPAGPVVLSRPIHTGVPGRERPLGNHIGVFVEGAAAAARGLSALLPPRAAREVPRLSATMVRSYGAAEARQGVAVDATHFYAVVNTAIGKYSRATGALEARWAGPRGGLIRHLNSCTVVARDLVCAHSNHPEVPMSSSVEIWDTATLAHKASHSLGNRDEGSLTIVEPYRDAGGEEGWLLGFAHYSDETGVPFKSSDYSGLISVDRAWRRTGGWTIPPAIRKRMAPQAASGGAIGPDGLLYLFGHTLPEMYVMAKPAMGAELLHVATIALEAGGQAFAFDPVEPRHIFTIERARGEVRVFALPELPPLPADARLFARPATGTAKAR
ncbi:MAG: phosphodiester glycosidase family protein [Polymorphobacter sp.]|uniref:phosphodiester glycosidase family protein n=1 Tax=Polymorphobacter sp. TaxID=1909290 RepID=UPI003A83612F